VKVAAFACIAYVAGMIITLAICKASSRPTPAIPPRQQVGEAAARPTGTPQPVGPAAETVNMYEAAFKSLAELTASRRARLDAAYRDAAVARFRQQIDAELPTYDGPRP
jgi:hypothetical protein